MGVLKNDVIRMLVLIYMMQWNWRKVEYDTKWKEEFNNVH
jgi:hypothetical protein